MEKGGRTKRTIAAEFGVPPNTLSSWIKNADSIKSAYESQHVDPVVCRVRKGQYEDIEIALLSWLQAQPKGFYASGLVLQVRAQEIAGSLGYRDFNCTMGWVQRFKSKKRNLIPVQK